MAVRASPQGAPVCAGKGSVRLTHSANPTQPRTSASSRLAASIPATSANVVAGTSLPPLLAGLRFLHGGRPARRRQVRDSLQWSPGTLSLPPTGWVSSSSRGNASGVQRQPHLLVPAWLRRNWRTMKMSGSSGIHSSSALANTLQGASTRGAGKVKPADWWEGAGVGRCPGRVAALVPAAQQPKPRPLSCLAAPCTTLLPRPQRRRRQPLSNT